MSAPTKTGIAPEPMKEIVLTPTDIAVGKIVDETRCTQDEATSCLAWVNGFVEAARADGYRWQYPETEQMAGRDYEIFDKVMEHGAVATPDSAHAAIESALLDPSRGELSLTHDERDEYGTLSYCSVQVALRVFRT